MIDRYLLEEMKNIWGEKNYYRKWKDVEAAVLNARGEDNLAEKVKKIEIEPEEVRKREEKSGHELNSFLSIIEDKIGKEAGKVHKGLTSSDVMDTARMLQVSDSLDLIENKLKENINKLVEKVEKYKDTVMCGRTHGQFAEPVTLGLKLARFWAHAKRNLDRLQDSRKRIKVGAISGAVGTYSLISPEQEKEILSDLGLRPSEISSQIIPRDVFGEYVYVLSLICSLCEEIANEIRLLSQDGVKEVTEPFASTQKGSSAMPHKRNPVVCERICGLSRLVKSMVQTALSNITLWNERDISHSSNERIILEEASCLTYYILVKTEFIVKNMDVHEKNIKNNLKKAGTRLFSSGVLKIVLDKGVSREKAYSFVKKLFSEEPSVEKIKNVLNKEFDIKPEEVEKVLEYKFYTRYVGEIIERVRKS